MIVTMRTPLDMLQHQRSVLLGEYDHVSPDGSTIAAVLAAHRARNVSEAVKVVDIGGNCGAFGLYVHQLAGAEVHVESYEPVQSNQSALRANYDPIPTHKGQLIAVVPRASAPKGGNHLAAVNHGVNEGCYVLEECACDDVSHATDFVHPNELPECDILKVDCEAWESGIIAEYLASHKEVPQYMAVEFHNQSATLSIIASAKKHGYVLLSYVMAHGDVGVLKFLLPSGVVR